MTQYFLWLEDAVRFDPGMVRESGIAATKPVFPSYLLPSRLLTLFSPSRRATAPPPYDDDDDADSNDGAGVRLSRTAVDTLRCAACSTDMALASQIVSKGFTGRYGRAYLVAPRARADSLLNIRLGRPESRQLVTGWHTVADISCGVCARKLGWKYVDAKEASQRYKIGKFILEAERVVTHRSWEDVSAARTGEEISGGEDKEEEEEEVEFDSQDEDECEDLFAGVWDGRIVAAKRGMRKAAFEG